MKKRIAGIDYSITSPAICIWYEHDGLFDFDGCDFHYLEGLQRWRRTARGQPPEHGILNLNTSAYPEWKSEEQRHDLLSDWAMTIITGCEVVFLEGYAFATVGKSYVRSVAENTGLLKHKMYKNGLDFTLVPPTVIKKYATGKGNANKELMYESFNSELLTPENMQGKITPKSKKLTNPVTDLVDSYFICKYGWEDFCVCQ